jgi:LuxR family maltose regulon positive regulatory protein
VAARSPTAEGPRFAFELLESKLRAPRDAGGSVARTTMVERLNGSASTPVVVVCAGAGYGKTTALAQWAASEGQRRSAWVSVDQHDNDPVVLLTYIAAAVDRLSALDPSVFDALASPGASVHANIVPRLGAALAGIDRAIALVLDDMHAIENPQCTDAVVALAGHLAEGSQLVLSTRDQLPLPLGLLRTRALLLEVGPDDLRMDEHEAGELLKAAEVDVCDADVAELVRRTEGWPAGLYLGALAARSARPGRVAGVLTGNDPFVADFLRSEFLGQLAPEDARFLIRTSILEQLSGPLCDAVLDSGGSSAMLESLVRSNRFMVALDRDRGWYRCHHLVREMLAAELASSEPELVPVLLGRAFDWCAANGQEVAAVGYGQAAADVDRVAATMERSIQPVFQSGRTATIEQWLDWLEAQGTLERYPAVAVIGAMFHAVSGRPTQADRWADAALHGGHEGPLLDGSSSIESWRALLRALRCEDGLEAMGADAALAVDTLAPQSTWRPAALALLGLSKLLTGFADEADDIFADATEEAGQLGAPDIAPIGLAARSVSAMARGEWARADELAERAVWTARHTRREDAAMNALVFAVAARTAQHGGRTASAHESVTRARRLLPHLTYGLPVVAALARLELAWTYLAFADHGGAGVMLREIDGILRRRPSLHTLEAQRDDLRSRLNTPVSSAPGISALTTAELRVLPLLTTHLTFREIGERHHLSRYTVKSHAMSIYRKLAVTSRSAAVDRAREAGLL